MLVLIGQRAFPGWKARMLDGNQRRLATTKAATAHRVYDDAHVGDQPRRKRGMKAATLWELHPVTHIAFSRACAP